MMRMASNCYKCGIELTDDNRSSSSRNKCKSCQSEYMKNYHIANADSLREKNHIRYMNNPEPTRKRSRDRHKVHREELNQKNRERQYAKGSRPMSENRDCPGFLGIHVAEQVLAKVFKNVERMPNGNPGYDFICGSGYMVDSKAVCILKNKPAWAFNIRKNKIAEYFILLAFDNRQDLNPQHIWLVPGDVINHKNAVYIGIAGVDKWKQYEIPIDKTIACCNAMKEAST